MEVYDPHNMMMEESEMKDDSDYATYEARYEYNGYAELHNEEVHYEVAEEARRMYDLQRARELEEEERARQEDTWKLKFAELEKSIANLQSENINLGKVVEAKDKMIANMENSVTMYKRRATEAEKKVSVADEEFEMLSEALDGKEKAITKLESELSEMRRGASVVGPSKSVPSNDVCLSARSYSDNILIKHRDESIEAKEKQIELLQDTNDKLIQAADDLEASLNSLQEQLADKAQVILLTQDELSTANIRIRDLQMELEKRTANRSAIDVATTQNIQLLQLLQEQEALAQELGERNQSMETQYQESIARYQMLMRKVADYEVRLEIQSLDIKNLNEEVASLRDSKDSQQQKNQVPRVDETDANRLSQINSLNEELGAWREKYFILLDRLQATEDQIRNIHDENARLRQEIVELRESSDDTRTKMQDAKQSHSKTTDTFMDTINNLQDQLKTLQHENTLIEAQRSSLTSELKTMSMTLANSVEQQRHLTKELLATREENNKNIERYETLKLKIQKDLKTRSKQKPSDAKATDSTPKKATTTATIPIPTQHSESANQTPREVREKRFETRLENMSHELSRTRSLAKDRLIAFRTMLEMSHSKDDKLSLNLRGCFNGESESEDSSSFYSCLISWIMSQLSEKRYSELNVNLSNNNINDTTLQQDLADLFRHPYDIAKVNFDVSDNNIEASGNQILGALLQTNPLVDRIEERNGSLTGMRGTTPVMTVNGAGNTVEIKKIKENTARKKTTLPRIKK